MSVKSLIRPSSLFYLFVGIFILFQGCSDTTAQTISAKEVKDRMDQKGVEKDIDRKVKELLSKLTLQDKVGEMTQLAIDMISVGDIYDLSEPHQLDPKKLKEVLVDLKVGSLLNCSGHGYSREHWHEIINEVQRFATKEKKSGIPVLYGIDAIHGVNFTNDATLFPQQLGLAATWNPDLAKELAAISAYETRASGIPWNFSPVLDVGRDPRWSRFWEGFGEDVHLGTKMGLAMIEGYEGDDISDPNKVASCMKHFLGYSVPLTGKDRTQAWVPERQLREYFLPTFQAAIDADATTIMICSAEMNGIPVHANPKILKDLLRDELGFEGVAVSDWEDIVFLHSRHKVAKDYKEAIKLAINAGVDMSMVPIDLDFTKLLKELVEEGEVPMTRIDEAVSRILKLKFQLGLFENPNYPMESYPKFASKEHTAKNLQAAEESIILLKNEKNILPLAEGQKVFVTGPTANSLNSLNGGWTNTWQGNDPKFNTKGKLTVLEAIQAKIGKDKVDFVQGTSFYEATDIQAAVAKAKAAKVAIVCLGETTYTEKPGDIDHLDLPMAQKELLKAIAATGTPIVLVMLEGRPRVINDIVGEADGILLANLPGNEGGRAIANILFGTTNPSGELPYSYPRYSNTLLTYDHKGTDQIKQDFSTKAFNPQWAFGYGLSYTTFSYSDLSMNKKVFGKSDAIKISVKVSNTGDRDGAEVVQLFIGDKVASITPSVKRLRGFEKIKLKAGESKNVVFELTPKDLAFVGIDHKWITEAGEFTVEVGDLKDSFLLE